MLVEDTSAFIEQLEVAEADRRVAKRRRRVTQARLEVLEVEWEVGLAAEALGNMERTLAEIDLATGSIARGLLRDRRARSLLREIAVTRRRLEGKRAELDYRVTCIFVDRDYRRTGAAGVALRGAIDLIANASGGVVEGYPQTRRARRSRPSFSTTPRAASMSRPASATNGPRARTIASCA